MARRRPCERKKVRRGGVGYHVPVWDIVSGIDRRQVMGRVEGGVKTEIEEGAGDDIVFRNRDDGNLEKLIHGLATNGSRSFAIDGVGYRSFPSIDPWCLPENLHTPKTLFVIGEIPTFSLSDGRLSISTGMRHYHERKIH